MGLRAPARGCPSAHRHAAGLGAAGGAWLSHIAFKSQPWLSLNTPMPPSRGQIWQRWDQAPAPAHHGPERGWAPRRAPRPSSCPQQQRNGTAGARWAPVAPVRGSPMAQKLPAAATSCLGTGNDSSSERCFLIDQREGRKKKKKGYFRV